MAKCCSVVVGRTKMTTTFPLSKQSQIYKLLLLFLLPILFCSLRGEAALLQGCDFGEELCDPGEICIPDGLFGQCYSDPEAAFVRPLVLERSLTEKQAKMLRSELSVLAKLGLDWPHARSQCVLAYFKLAAAFRLEYDPEFCDVRDPANIWALVQRVQNSLLAEVEQVEDEEEEKEKQLEEAQIGDEGQSLLTGVNEEDDADEEENEVGKEREEGRGEGRDGNEEENPSVKLEFIPVLLLDPNEDKDKLNGKNAYQIAEEKGEEKEDEDEEKNKEPSKLIEKTKRNNQGETLNAPENAQLEQILQKLLLQKEGEDGEKEGKAVKTLSDKQITRLVKFVKQLQNLVEEGIERRAEEEEEKLVNSMKKGQEEVESKENEEEEEGVEEVNDLSGRPVLLLKKDSEQFNNADMGLAHTVHKIVKGGIQRVEGNRVYLRVAKENLTEEELYKLIAYLDRKIAAPNNLYFDQFLYEDGQLSFRISNPSLTMQKPTKVDSASGIAQAVYKRRKDIQDVVPVERSQRDQLFIPILAVSAMTICALLSVLASTIIRRRRDSNKKMLPILPQTIGQDDKIYAELCRQRAETIPHSVAVIEGSGQRSKHSSTSSFHENETFGASNGSDMDIGTGHVLLAFLQKHLENPNEINKQWESVKDYEASEEVAQCKVAKREENVGKNFDSGTLPYDESRVQLHENDLAELSDGKGYINASMIFDSNPEQPAYIAAQTPLEQTASQFWQMIWEQGIGLIVNLCDKGDNYFKYWPEEGVKLFGCFEAHLVSEHIWSEHYVIRSLYLKNTATQETRTVTQFHFTSWAAGGVPASNKALLEFRRKVNKSYRGRASPVLVHCTNGVKELNIAASLEHLRDQRMKMVENEQQFKCVFSCIADEISLLLKGIQH
ncbi:unnamed protein product [Meloidogyne enterolobii]|uniref:Uncharacterized protein n=1 Tax=Meloidogyne enterolobii TaxID=390850 RepID=A0ACB0YSE8_MELEN